MKQNKKPTLTEILRGEPWEDITDKIEWHGDRGDYQTKNHGLFQDIIQRKHNKLYFPSGWGTFLDQHILPFTKVNFLLYRRRLYVIEFKHPSTYSKFNKKWILK